VGPAPGRIDDDRLDLGRLEGGDGGAGSGGRSASDALKVAGKSRSTPLARTSRWSPLR
jgi:hypothetical protein